MSRSLRHGWAGSLAVAGTVALSGCGADAEPVASTTSPSSTTSQSAATVAPTPLPPVQDVSAVGAKSLAVQPFADFAMAVGTNVWVSGVDPGIVAYDGRTGRRLGGVAVGDVIQAMDQDGASLWAASGDGYLARVDGRSRKLVARVRLPAPPQEESSVAAGGGSAFVLVLTAPPAIAVVDASSNRLLRTIPAPPGASAVRHGFDSLWVPSTDGVLHRLDPRDGTELARVRVGAVPRFLAVNSSAVWVLNQQDGTVSRVAPDGATVLATVRVSDRPVDGGDLAVTDRLVWARVSDALVAAIDVRDNRVTTRIGPEAGSGSVAVGDQLAGNVWVTAHDVDTVWRIPPG